MAAELKVWYQTSFSPDLYNASGRDLLQSWRDVGAPEHMLVCPEGLPEFVTPSTNVTVMPLDGDVFLRNWLDTNKHIVPDYLGGTAVECTCLGREKRHAKHKPGCHWSWMQRNAFRFLRKVASWRLAALRGDIDILIWLDSDCTFVKPPSTKVLLEFFAGSSMFYFRAHRPAIESGILGFDFRKHGKLLVDLVWKRYLDGTFLAYERWDDGFILGTVVDDLKKSNTPGFTKLTRDVCPPIVYRKGSKKVDNHVMKHTPMWKYIQHNKGHHSRTDTMK